MDWELVFYETASGRAPVRDYLRSLSKRELSRLTEALDDLEEFGTELGMPRVRRMAGSPLWELKIRGSNQYRVFYVAISGRRILLLHAFLKKSRTTPRREIETAERRLADYQDRFGS